MNRKTRMLTMNALLIALLFLLGLTPIGNISILGINITMMAYPVIVGTLVLGLKSGLLLGFFFGAINFFKTFIMPSALTAPLLFNSLHWYGPILYFIMMMVPRLLVPVVVYLVGKIERIRPALRYAVAAIAGCLTNTVLFLGMMYLFFCQDIEINYTLSAAGVFALLGGIAATNGVVEACASVVCSPIVLALKAASGRLFTDEQ